jgi:hypothetical protein
MNLDNLKNNVCTLSTRNLDPSLTTADIRVAFTSDDKSKLDDYIRSAIGFNLTDNYTVSPYVNSVASMSGIAGVIKATGKDGADVVHYNVYDLDSKSMPLPSESFMDIMEGYMGEDLNTQLINWVEELGVHT